MASEVKIIGGIWGRGPGGRFKEAGFGRVNPETAGG